MQRRFRKNLKNNDMKKSCLVMLLSFLVFSPAQVFSQSMSNESYKLELNSNPRSNSKDSNSNLNISKSPGTSENKIIGDNYIIELSYEGDNKLPVVLTVSNDSLDFGNIEAGDPLIRTHSVGVLSGSSQGYQVFSFENHSLKSGEIEIPNTTCDTGNCNQILSDLWVNPLTYGFGYRCDSIGGNPCSDNMQKDYFKRPANEAFNEFPTPIIVSLTPIDSQSIISYKINISGTQPNKEYQNIIYYILTPNL